MNAVHDFKECLEVSKSEEAAAFFEKLYRLAFPTMVAMEDCSNDMACQKVGIDRRVVLACGRKIKIDEKYRRNSTFPDVLIEYLSSDTSGSPGWIEKDMGIDYIAYGIPYLGIALLLPWDLLRQAWLSNKKDWLAKARELKEGFRLVVATNEGYKTHSVVVPFRDIEEAIRRELCVRVSGYA